MEDDKKNVGGQDRSRVPASNSTKLPILQKHGLNAAQALEIIELSGNSREKADAAAEKRLRK